MYHTILNRFYYIHPKDSLDPKKAYAFIDEDGRISNIKWAIVNENGLYKLDARSARHLIRHSVNENTPKTATNLPYEMREVA